MLGRVDWGIKAISLEGAVLADVWLDESAGRGSGRHLGCLVVHDPGFFGGVAIGTFVGRTVEEL
jgi:hypothetical protein